MATAFADLGFDVDIGSLFQTPEECARQAIENDARRRRQHPGRRPQDPGAGHHQRTEEAGCRRHHRLVGGVIPRQDYDYLYEAGVKGIDGPGTPIPASAKDVLEQIKRAVAKV